MANDSTRYTLNEKLISDALTVAASRGKVPYIFSLDANTHHDKSEVIQSALLTGRWFLACQELGSDCPVTHEFLEPIRSGPHL